MTMEKPKADYTIVHTDDNWKYKTFVMPQYPRLTKAMKHQLKLQKYREKMMEAERVNNYNNLLID